MSDSLSRTPKKGKIVNLRIKFLDDSVHAFQVHIKAVGHELWEAVIRHLHLVESDYFDLQYEDLHSIKCWLDHEKAIMKQLPTPDSPLEFCVKFYTPDPGLLDEFTRYLFALQIKKDLASGAMTCSENTAALIASYIAQAEIGDYIIEEYADHTYLLQLSAFIPNQTDELLKKVMEYHKQHIGESPEEAESNLLDTARKVDTYGIKLHEAKDHEGTPLHLATAHMGILVFQHQTKINTFSWAKIRKLSFKRKKFLVKLHPDTYQGKEKGYYKDTVEFFFESRDESKVFWKKCIEHHAFFRCQTSRKLPRNKTRLVSRGSSFRYSGRTQKELMKYVRETPVKSPSFERSVSGRISTASRSASVTPKIPIKLNLHNSNTDTHNSTASSGSHILSPGPQAESPRVETADVHSADGSSVSGSQTIGSPKLDQTQSVETPQGDGITISLDEGEERPDAEEQEADERDFPPPYHVYIQQHHHALSKVDRKLSAPVLGAKEIAEQNLQNEHRLSRCEEVENIPEVVEEEPPMDDLQPPPPPMTRSFSTAASPVYERDDSPPPPPPPPPLDDDEINMNIAITPPNHRSTPVKNSDHYFITHTSLENNIPHSNMSVLSSSRTEDSEDDPKRKMKRHPADRAYYIAKELLMTERTYKKDLEVVVLWFRNAVCGDGGEAPDYVADLFTYMEPIYQFHCQFLKDVDQRISLWEGKSNAHLNGDYQRIGDLMFHTFLKALDLYKNFLDKQEDMLTKLNQAVQKNRQFELIYYEFESQKVCYLPFNTFVLKPAQRLLHYKLILERLTKHYSTDHSDFTDCKAAFSKIMDLVIEYREKMKRQENLQKLMELQRDMVGLDTLVQVDRIFIREGCLQKFSRKGYQQRMFFLFSDLLVYTSRTSASVLQFKVHGQLPLRGMIVEESDHAKMAVANSFAIYGGNKCILVAASSQEEKDKWIEDLNEAILQAKSRNDDKLKYSSLKTSSSSMDNDQTEEHNDKNSGGPEKQIQHRANTTMHVCWHRNTSVSMRDHERAVKNQLSGYLLRKFKNSNGWQKLWVVFTNFCLFFYKTYQDDFPLASLPLLGYAVNTPEEEDGIHKDHVFKLQFKNHMYFFRAESEYTFERWMEVINSATHSARRLRLFSRLDSNQTAS